MNAPAGSVAAGWAIASTGPSCNTDRSAAGVRDSSDTERIAVDYLAIAGVAAERLTSTGLLSAQVLADELFRAGERLSQESRNLEKASRIRKIAIHLSGAARKLEIVRC